MITAKEALEKTSKKRMLLVKETAQEIFDQIEEQVNAEDGLQTSHFIYKVDEKEFEYPLFLETFEYIKDELTRNGFKVWTENAIESSILGSNFSTNVTRLFVDWSGEVKGECDE